MFAERSGLLMKHLDLVLVLREFTLFCFQYHVLEPLLPWIEKELLELRAWLCVCVPP